VRNTPPCCIRFTPLVAPLKQISPEPAGKLIAPERPGIGFLRRFIASWLGDPLISYGEACSLPTAQRKEQEQLSRHQYLVFSVVRPFEGRG
jgi:hypothetical protein